MCDTVVPHKFHQHGTAVSSAWHSRSLGRKQPLHRYGTTVTSVCNRSQATSRMFRNRHRTCLDHRCHTVPVYSKCFFARSVREAVRLCALDSMFCARNGSRACWQLLAFAGRASAPAFRRNRVHKSACRKGGNRGSRWFGSFGV